MNKPATIAICAVLLSCGCRTPSYSDPRPIRIAETTYFCAFGHVTYDSVVTRDQVLKTPIWKPESGHPPLVARKADRLATERFHRLAGRPPDLTRTEIRLVDMGDGLHWFYVVMFEDVTNPYAGLPPSGSIAVLMDGTVIEPKVRQKQ